MKKLLVILDAGHGGIVDGQYVTAPSKQFQHADGSWAYEGVINRKVKEALKPKLKANKIAFYDVCPYEADTPLPVRVAAANVTKVANYQYNCLYLSIHSNAGGGTGFEVFTTPGQTKSDDYATIIGNEIKKTFPEITFRADTTDGDLDKEAKFYVLVHTAMPAVLVELLFFDNAADWALIQTPEYIEKISQALVDAIVKAQSEIS